MVLDAFLEKAIEAEEPEVSMQAANPGTNGLINPVPSGMHFSTFIATSIQCRSSSPATGIYHQTRLYHGSQPMRRDNISAAQPDHRLARLSTDL